MSDSIATTPTNEPPWVEGVLHFWFGELGERLWFNPGDAIDGQIRARFLALHEWLVGGEAGEPVGARPVLATVIVLDQFSRNLFRGTPRAFAADPVARRLARQAISQGLDAGMSDAERYFLYLPFEHSEDRDDQALAVQLVRRLGNEIWTRYALAHQSIIDRFGRFPHRNAVLGRASSKEELELLKEPMGSF
jgi:uncharacterized protein (DUF924 family)